MSGFSICLNRNTRACIVFWLICLSSITVYAQDQPVVVQPRKLTITEAYEQGRVNYPLIRQRELIRQSAAYTIENAAKAYLPVLSLNGQATYQSAVTNLPISLPIAGFSLPNAQKDQYKFYGEVNQQIYEAGMIKNERAMARAKAKIDEQSLEVDLYGLYERINQLFFGILLLQAQEQQNLLLQKDLHNGLEKIKALVANGVAYRSSADEIAAQLLQAEQSGVVLHSAEKGYTAMLRQFLLMKVEDASIQLEKPPMPQLNSTISRPELALFDEQQQMEVLQVQQLKIQLRPKLGFFLQGGYGRPGLNMLSDQFEWFYLGGLKLSWNLGSWYTLGNQKRILGMNRQMLGIQKETFLFNTRLSQARQLADLEQYKELLKKDDAIISLRLSVKNAASAQLENGVSSVHDYITQINAEDVARQNRLLHEIQLLQAQYTYMQISGNFFKP